MYVTLLKSIVIKTFRGFVRFARGTRIYLDPKTQIGYADNCHFFVSPSEYAITN